MAMTLWHNPRCSKSRQAVKLLEDAGHRPKLRLYLKEPPNEEELVALLEALNKLPSAVIRKGERIYKEMGLAEATEEQLYEAMLAEPILIERPILVNDDKAIVGRPPEDVLTIV